MLSYIVRRVFQSVIVLLVVGLVAFSMFTFVGDPVDNMLGQERTQADIDRLRTQLGLDQPFPVQYWSCGDEHGRLPVIQEPAEGRALPRVGASALETQALYGSQILPSGHDLR